MIIQSKRIWIAGQFIAAQLEIQEGKILRVLPYDSRQADEDCGNDRIVPGFIDIHTHGAYNFDTNDGEPEGLREWMRRIPEEGVTSILPTTVTQMPDVLEKAVANVAAVAREGYEGAEMLGIHFEGPYLDMEYKGAQPPEAIAKATVEQFKRYQEAAEGMIKYITLAPEHDADFALTRYCSQNGVVVSMGHSSATYEQALLGIANGATSMTHVYNGMTPYHHRKPGLVGTALRVRDIYGEVICDGCHSHLAALNNFFTAKGRDYSIMISDSLRAKHCPPGGAYQLGGHDIEIGEDGLARLKGTETIAGSTLFLNRGLKILVEDAMVPFDTALNSCTINPARCLGVDDRKGRIAAGLDADLVRLADDYGVLQTWCRGAKML
ncbi:MULTISPECIES: N-acetylglucosamine-6-phosphate deacetylase [Enterocloster]|uniref:N-acetylglucosamine-6-phosphate deacetylase n=2 Tax=Enterocloster lavalensis TaxID=460384 RepID=A0A1I0KE73_9FIRM|nr:MULTISPECIES: N-acetylglucosamine-6-phosphate deacetylase [Enterocloster]MDR3757028.1 N-acetylglucosamine-6-phosphate deacetylase [Enterocloster sp.]PST33677.1 N-acetylglucosamine-6-phosphate deacetylase [Enterocloster lavalensis]SEU21991.1 N-acetylglucosamine-6-phosphate deacetylase [Enterocloster lavalensis]